MSVIYREYIFRVVSIFSKTYTVDMNHNMEYFVYKVSQYQNLMHIYSLLLYIGNGGTFSLDAMQSRNIETCNIKPQGNCVQRR